MIMNLNILLLAIYNLTILAGCSYIVFGLGHSGWWFLLALACMGTSKKDD